MVNIYYQPNKRQLRMKGHAGYATDGGDDILCSACSTLFYTLCQTLVSEQKRLATEPKMSMTKGLASVQCIPKDGEEATIDCCYFTILNGFHMLAEQYPEYVHLTIMKRK